MMVGDSDTPSFHHLTLNSHSHPWAQAEIRGIGDTDPIDVLLGDAVPAITVRADPGGTVGDLIGTSWASLYLVSATFVDVVHEAELTGCAFRPAATTGRSDIEKVFLLQIGGRCGPVQKVEFWERVDAESWDGSDFFAAARDGTIFLSPRAAGVLSRARLRNVAVEPSGITFD